jgi:hypothetical protein
MMDVMHVRTKEGRRYSVLTIETTSSIMQKQNNNPATNRHLKLQIKTLQNTPREADKLEALL